MVFLVYIYSYLFKLNSNVYENFLTLLSFLSWAVLILGGIPWNVVFRSDLNGVCRAPMWKKSRAEMLSRKVHSSSAGTSSCWCLGKTIIEAPQSLWHVWRVTLENFVPGNSVWSMFSDILDIFIEHFFRFIVRFSLFFGCRHFGRGYTDWQNFKIQEII